MILYLCQKQDPSKENLINSTKTKFFYFEKVYYDNVEADMVGRNTYKHPAFDKELSISKKIFQTL